jgi:DNA repair protein RadC
MLSDAEALELLFARSAPASAAERAAALLAAFGSLPEVLAAGFPDLRRTVGASAALDLKLTHDLARRLLGAPLRRRPVLSSWSSVLAYLRTVMTGVPREQFRVLFLDKKNQLIADEVMGRGTVDHAPVYPREVVRRALELNASALVLAHNHPSGDPTPSTADVDMTRQIVEAARTLSIAVHDHIVVGGAETASLRALGLMS